ncbi:MAG: hypothetical protein R2941_17820 [Desulfobacterales bacterium]
MSVYDAYDTVSTLADPCSSTFDKGASVGGIVLGMVLPGAGYGKASKKVIGFAEGTVETALTGMRGGGHAIRHIEGNLIPNTGSLQSRVDAFKQIATPILENPRHAADWRIGGTQARAFLGEVNGQNLAIVVAKEGPHQGKVISSFIPDANQLQLQLLLSR